MQSISVIQLVSASHSTQEQVTPAWHHSEDAGEGASLALAGWLCTRPGFEETSGDCREISAPLGNFTQSWTSAGC